jgi:hypothetical protein
MAKIYKCTSNLCDNSVRDMQQSLQVAKLNTEKQDWETALADINYFHFLWDKVSVSD